MWTTNRSGVNLLGIFFLVALSSRVFGDETPGSYCAAKYPRGACCSKHREDNCTAPISTNHLCYCDNFCNDNHYDCCPDFLTHCKTETPEVQLAEEIPKCYWDGNYYNVGDRFKLNCKECACLSQRTGSEIHCDIEPCLVDPDLLATVEASKCDLGWRAANQSKFWGRKLEEGLWYRLGAKEYNASTKIPFPKGIDTRPRSLPENFDSRENWPDYISKIRDQGWCAASWALSIVDVVSDRFAIKSDGTEKPKLSAQHLLSCHNKYGHGCRGGDVEQAWFVLADFGLVDEECYPWTGKDEPCKLSQNPKTFGDAGCKNPSNGREKLYDTEIFYPLSGEKEIMNEIIEFGPVQATMKVYPDLYVYNDGIYRHTKFDMYDYWGWHGVRIVGWGTEKSRDGILEKYWIVANSWGEDWGENGYFRILRGTNECDIESRVYGASVNTM